MARLFRLFAIAATLVVLALSVNAPAPAIFAGSSPWNTPFPTQFFPCSPYPACSYDTNDANYIGAILDAYDNSGGASIAWSSYSTPLYTIDSSTQSCSPDPDCFYDVTLTNPDDYWGEDYLLQVPIPPGAAPDDDGDDQHMTIIDSHTGCLYDFWHAAKVSGVWQAEWANRIPDYTNGNGIYDHGASTKGSGFSNMAGLIRPSEVTGPGTISHALFFALLNDLVKSGGPVSPATESDGASTATWALPEGARLREDPTWWGSHRSDYSGAAYLQKIGDALRDYGGYLGDNGGTGNPAFALYAEDTEEDGGSSYPWGSTEFPTIPRAIIEHLHVIALPSQSTPSHYLEDTSCAHYDPWPPPPAPQTGFSDGGD